MINMKRKNKIKNKIVIKYLDRTLKVERDESNPNIIIINGEKYFPNKTTLKKIGQFKHLDKTIYKKLSDSNFEKELDFVVNKLSDKVNPFEILFELLKTLDSKVVHELFLRLQKKEKIKKIHGCLGFEIGNKYLSIID